MPAVNRRAGDTGSIPLALLVTILGLALSAMLVPIVLTQVSSTRLQSRRAASLHAAQTGLDVAMAQIRATAGDASKLPCTPLTGDVGVNAAAHYRVTVDYFGFVPDPGSYLDAQGNYVDAWISANHLACPGPTPAFALIRAQGSADQPVTAAGCPSTVRCVRATYTFDVKNRSLGGGLIHVYKTATSNDLCLSAGNDTLTAAVLTGTALIVQNCDLSKPAQVFSYNRDLTVQLMGSRTSDNPGGMCLDNRAAAGLAVQLRPCASASQSTQRWIFTSGTAFMAPDGTCLKVSTPNIAGSTVVHDNTQCAVSGYDDVADFSPDPGVGTGAAGTATSQLVNDGQYSRCVDVPRQNVAWHSGTDGPYLVAWGCKQTTPVDWNQTWTLPATSGLVTATAPGTDPPQGSAAGRYCLRSPASSVALQFVTAVACPVGPPAPAHTTWTLSGDTGDYRTSYRITDDTGLCLQPQDAAARAADPNPFTDGPDISKLVVQPCTDSTLQKWNPPPDLGNAAPLNTIGER